MSASPASSPQKGGGGGGGDQEFRVRIPTRNDKRTFHVMKFNASLKMDPSKWGQVRMVRENNKKDHKSWGADEDEPKFGAGSEFGRQEREEARRRKFGGKARKYNPEAQPWLMRLGSKRDGKTYKGSREGGVTENTTYYVFTHAADGSFEAHPVKEWYNFVPRLTYKTLDAEEAEERFAERGKVLNHWAIAVNKKVKASQEGNNDDDDLDEDGGKKKGKHAKGKKDMKISDLDDWVESGDELDSDSDGDGKKKDSDDDDDGVKKGKKGGRSKDSRKKKKKKEEADSEGFEDSDDGDDEGREVDYMSDESSDSEGELEEKANIKGVDMDEGLAKMLDSDSSEDEDANKEKEKANEEEDETKPKKEEDGGEEAAGSDTPKKGKKGKGKGSKNSSRAATPTPDEGEEKNARAEKRKAMVDNLLDPNATGESSSKKSRMDPFGQGSSSSGAGGSGGGAANPPPPVGSVEAAFEEDVRRYLARKPMTTTEILKKFKSKKTGVGKDELMPMLVNALKRINPHKHKVKGTMYLSLKDPKK